MRKLIEATHVSLGGEVGSIDWAHPYLDDEHNRYSLDLLTSSDALLLGRKTYEGLSAAYPAMETTARGAFADFVNRINAIPKHVATTTLTDLTWNAEPIMGDVVEFVQALKKQPGCNILKYGTGPLDAQLLKYKLIDEYHFWMAPVATGSSQQRLFEDITGPTPLRLLGLEQFASGVVALRYAPTSF
jgi:dihydrofolate reductase